jgi:flagellar basal body rod protein FlgC
MPNIDPDTLGEFKMPNIDIVEEMLHLNKSYLFI